MNIFKTFGNELNYKDILQLDGAFSTAHINYDNSPKFNGSDSKDMAKNSRENSLSNEEKIENVIDNIRNFDGTEKNFTIEVGFKYLLLKRTGQITKIHDLKILSDSLYSEYNINDDYMRYIKDFCENFCTYIEGGNVEYFRFPEYKCNTYFAGNRLDISWLSYNFALIILKLVHFANLESEL